MEAFALYLLKSVIWLTGFALVYFLFLRNERFFLIKRYYLLSGILISFIFPFISVRYQIVLPAPEVNAANFIPTDNIITSSVQQIIPNKPFDYKLILLILYLAGVLFFAFRLMWHIRSLYKRIKKANINNRGPAKLIRSSEFSSSFSFFNYVFVNPSVSETEVEEIMNHELEHLKQKHWIDLLLGELLRMLQWANPFAWVYTSFIRLNHEYLADMVALQRSDNPAKYRAVLLNQMFRTPILSLSNPFNYSLNKNRFEMMKNKIISPYRKLKVLLLLPVFAIVFYAFSIPDYQYTTPDEIKNAISQVDVNVGKGIRGVVYNEENKPMIGVTVIITGASMGTVTDQAGNFAISNIPENKSLEFKSLGFKTLILTPDFSNEMIIKMEKDPEYSKTVPYKYVPPRIAPPGQTPIPTPLIVVDGVIREKGMNGINPENIVAVHMLKDQAALDYYGEKGKYGVVEITLRSNISLNIQQEVKGTVYKEDGQPFQAVQIAVTGTDIRGTTDASGNFALAGVPEGSHLVFSYRGHLTQVLKPQFSGSMTIKLLKDPEYPGIRVSSSYQNALVVIDDGISEKPYVEALKDIDPNQIARISVMRDKAALDKYGEKGKNGVVEIITRKKAAELGIKVPFRRQNPDDYPTFRGESFSKFCSWLAERIKYPADVAAKGIEGRVNVNFVIQPDGTISNATIMSAPDPLLGESVVKAVNESPRWEPARNPEVQDPFSTSVTLKFALPDKITPDDTYITVEQMPEFPGGGSSLLDYIQKNLKYPAAAIADKIEGRVIVRFVVTAKGKVEDATVLKGLNPLLDAEALRVINSLSGWLPGAQGGKPVNVWYMVPVNFSLTSGIGQKAPDFTLNDVNGNPISLSSKIGSKLLLIDFWAAWCSPCRIENPNLVRVFNEFKSKGFDIFGVSLDRTREEWIKAIADDKLTWTHVSDLQYGSSAVVKLYGIAGIPSNFLLDQNGIIIAKNIRGEELYNKVREFLSKK